MSTNDNLLPLEAHIVFSDDLVIRENKDGTVVAMKMDDGDLFYKIDGVAAEIFKDLKKQIDLKTSVEKVAKTYQVDISVVHSDVSAFLRKLINLKFITLE